MIPMKLWLVPAAALMMAAAACSKTEETCPVNTIQAPAEEVASLRQYIDTNGISAIYDNRGFYYAIQDTGSAERPTACSNVTVDYLGKLTNGKTFDQGTNVAFNLPNLITGWKQGIPLIGRGGKITLYLTPSAGYGTTERGSIPANSILIFQIYLTRINPTNF